MRSAALRLFYGWYVVSGAFLMTFVAFGSAYSFGPFVEPLQREFSATRGEVSLAFSLAGFLYFFLGVLTGPLSDRIGARPLCLIGMILTAAGLASAAWAQTLGHVLLAYGLGVGLGIGCAYVPALGVVQRWFSRQRGLASGLAVSGIGLGTLAVPPLASWLIEALGWREAYLGLAGLVAVVGGAAALLLKEDPRDLGLSPDGDPSVGQALAAVGLGVAEAVRSVPFELLYVGSLLIGFGVFVPFVHLVPYATDLNVPASAAAWLIALIGIGSTLGRFALGGLADRLGRARSLAAMTAGMGLALCLWAASDGFLLLAVFATAFGAFYGGWVALLPALAADLFGARRVSGIIGALYTSAALGTLAGPAVAGYVFDWTGSYLPAILASASATFIGALLSGLSSRFSRPA